jgi:hypothetical protein
VTGTGSFGQLAAASTNFKVNTFGDVTCNALTTGGISTFSLNATGGIGCTSLSASSSITIYNGGYKFNADPISGDLLVAGQITAKYPMTLYGWATQLLYNTSGTNVGSVGTNSSGFVKWGTIAANNWTPAYTDNCRLQVPFTGIYTISWTLGMSTNASGVIFITKNTLLSANQVDNALNCMAIQAWSVSIPAFEVNCSTNAYLTAGDLINFGFLTGGAGVGVTLSARSVMQMSLIQRTA